MAEDSDGQQITVAELLKRMGAEQQDAPSGRRRRRSDEGGVSVSELTGEIPRITDDTVLSGRAARRRAREEEEEPADGESPSAEGADVGTARPGESTTTKSSTPQSARSAASAAQAPAGQAQTRQGPPVTPSGQAQTRQGPPVTPSGQTPAGPSPTGQPASAPSAATTAKLPAQPPQNVQQAPAGQGAQADSATSPSRTETTAPKPTAQPADADEDSGHGEKIRGRRGLFGRKRKDAAADDAADAQTSGQRSEGGKDGAGAAAAVAGGAAGVAGAAAAGSAITPKAEPQQPGKSGQSGQATAGADAPGSTNVGTAATGTAATGPAPTGLAGAGPTKDPQAQNLGVPSGSGSTAHRAPEAPGDVPAPASEEAADTRNHDESASREGGLGATTAAAAGGAGVAGMTAAALSGGRDSDNAATEQYRDLDSDVDHGPPERSGASQWLILIAQVLASAVAGAALFIGFQLLWGDLPWVAFALAIIVIVGLVAMVRVLRRSNDKVSIALAVIVGIGVTCGPLLLRLVT